MNSNTTRKRMRRNKTRKSVKKKRAKPYRVPVQPPTSRECSLYTLKILSYVKQTNHKCKFNILKSPKYSFTVQVVYVSEKMVIPFSESFTRFVIILFHPPFSKSKSLPSIDV